MIDAISYHYLSTNFFHLLTILSYLAEPNPQVDLSISVDGLSLVAVWNKPFSLKGEVVSYVIFITNKASGVQEEVKTNTTTYILSEPIGERDCAEYMFTIFSNNSYSTSTTNISGYETFPTGNIHCIGAMEMLLTN